WRWLACPIILLSATDPAPHLICGLRLCFPVSLILVHFCHSRPVGVDQYERRPAVCGEQWTLRRSVQASIQSAERKHTTVPGSFRAGLFDSLVVQSDVCEKWKLTVWSPNLLPVSLESGQQL